jgi:hypothetical protein
VGFDALDFGSVTTSLTVNLPDGLMIVGYIYRRNDINDSDTQLFPLVLFEAGRSGGVFWGCIDGKSKSMITGTSVWFGGGS